MIPEFILFHINRKHKYNQSQSVLLISDTGNWDRRVKIMMLVSLSSSEVVSFSDEYHGYLERLNQD